MIKVLDKKTEEPKAYKTICDECRAELEYEYEDTHEGYAGMRHITCPECGYEIMSEYFDGVELDSSNVEFPKHFYRFGNGKDIPDHEIQSWVRRCLKQAEECGEPYGYFFHTGTGNSMVILMGYEDEYNIIVAKDYYELSITKEL
jgi:DNA-directed RNA polymerase subunit RPC12/RpoP